MPFMQTNQVYEYSGSLASLLAEPIASLSLLNALSGPKTATFHDDDGVFSSDGAPTRITVDGYEKALATFVGSGTMQALTLLGIPLLAVPVAVFVVEGNAYIFAPEGLPLLAGLTIDLSLSDTPFPMSNPQQICVGAESMIETPSGAVRAGNLRAGDPVLTLDHGPQPIRWIGRGSISAARLQEKPYQAPIILPRGCFGPDCPSRDLRVTRNHRILVLLGEREVFAPAHCLTGQHGIAPAPPEDLNICHFLFDRHEILITNGCATESLYLGPRVLTSLPEPTFRDIRRFFPGITRDGPAPFPTARPCMRPGKFARSGPWRGYVPRLQQTAARRPELAAAP